MNRIEHHWVEFRNPRNKRVTVVACAHCGVAKGSLGARAKCSSKPEDLHQMKKMGWVAVSD